MNSLLIQILLIAMINPIPKLGQDTSVCDHCNEEGRAVVILEGNTNKAESRSSTTITTYDLSNWFSTAVIGPNTSKGISLQGRDVCAMGGTIKGMIPDSLTWLEVHDDVGGHAFQIHVDSGNATLLNARVHNVEDGYKPRETPYYSNTGTMVVQGAYMTKIRDDCIENDGFMPGRIEDCLFDGVFVFYSEQEQSRLPAPIVSISSEEDSLVTISNVLVRTDVTNGPGVFLHYNAGFWFKLMPYDKGAVIHKLKIENSVFAISVVPKDKHGNADWRRTSFPRGTQWSGENYILWLGSGEYGGEIPNGVKFLEGPEANSKWNELRRNWLMAHDYLPSKINAVSGNGQVKLEWNSASKAVSYTINRSTSKAGPYEEISSELTGNSFIDKEVNDGLTYYYRLAAVDNCGVNQNCEEVFAKPE